MAEITKPIMLDETGRALVDKINELKNVLAPTGTLNVAENGTYDVSEKASAVVNVINHTLVVTAETGSIVTATKDEVTVTATESATEAGSFTAILPTLGTWSVTATKGTKSKTVTANVTAASKTIVYEKTLAEMALGSTVYLYEDDISNWVAYEVVEKRPNSNAVAILRKDIVTSLTTDVTYANGIIDTYLQSTFINKFGNNVKNLFVNQDVKYIDMSDNPILVKTISRKAFIPSVYELEGKIVGDRYQDADSVWNFTKRTNTTYYWLRSPSTSWEGEVFYVTSNTGWYNSAGISKSYGVRPAIWLTESAIVDTEDSNKIKVS